MAAEKRKDKAKKRVVVVEAVGEAHIKATFNNIIVSMTKLRSSVANKAARSADSSALRRHS